jgi:hypothetical protein
LAIPTLAFAALTLGYVVVGRSTPHPDATGAAVLAYTTTHAGTAQLGSFLLLASAVPLTVAAAVAYRRLRALGITAPGSAIAFAGGLLAAAALCLGAAATWAGARLTASAGPDLARAVADLGFLSAGPGYAVMFGLLVAGIAVPALLARLLPRWLSGLGLAIAGAAALASLTPVVSGFAYLLPVVRFGGLLWLVAAAFLLPRTRPRTR